MLGRFGIKVAFGVAVVLLWTVCAIFTLELVLRARTAWINSQNDLVRQNRTGVHPPREILGHGEPLTVSPPSLTCIGGSTTAEGADNDSTYPALLERNLREDFPGKRIEVLNYGVQGLRTRGQFVHMPTFLNLEADLVIAYIGVNDLWHDIPAPPRGHPENTIQEIFNLAGRLANWYLPWTADRKRQWIRDTTIANADSMRRIFGRTGTRFVLCTIAHPRPESLSREVLQYQRYHFNHLEYLCALAEFENEAIREYSAENNLFYIPFDENFHRYEHMFDWCHVPHDAKALKADTRLHATKQAGKPGRYNSDKRAAGRKVSILEVAGRRKHRSGTRHYPRSMADQLTINLVLCGPRKVGEAQDESRETGHHRCFKINGHWDHDRGSDGCRQHNRIPHNTTPFVRLIEEDCNRLH